MSTTVIQRHRKMHAGSGRSVLLQAALAIREEFNPEDLTVAAWHRDQAFFGLVGHELDHPDINRVLTIIYGPTGFLRKGLFEKVGPKLFRLTELGRQLAKGEAN